MELSYMEWSILGLSEGRREDENTMILESGHVFYFREGLHLLGTLSQGGVGFLFHKTQ